MQITYNSRRFPATLGPLLRGTNTLTFTSQELLWAAITVGRANLIDVISHGIYSQYEILYRASIVVANVAQQGADLVKSTAYQSLDPSEKGAISYFLGLTFSKLLSNKLLNVPWLLHIDIYRSHFRRAGTAVNYGSSRKRPDLIGLDSAFRWVVLESKGRTNGYAASLLTTAKAQTRNLRNIGGVAPHLRIAAVTHFATGLLTVDWQDPEGHNEKSFDLFTNIEEYLSFYYKPFVQILDNNETVEVANYTVYTFANVQLTVGLDTDIYNAYKSQSLKTISVQKIVRNEKFLQFPEQDFYAGSDGVIIGLGENWKELIRTNEKFNV